MIDKILLFPYYLVLKLRDRRFSRPGRKFHYADINVDTPSLGIFFAFLSKKNARRRISSDAYLSFPGSFASALCACV